MTGLSLQSLEQMLMNLAGQIVNAEERMAIKPKYLITSPVIYRKLMWRPPLVKRRGVRGRRLALKKRAVRKLWWYLK